MTRASRLHRLAVLRLLRSRGPHRFDSLESRWLGLGFHPHELTRAMHQALADGFVSATTTGRGVHLAPTAAGERSSSVWRAELSQVPELVRDLFVLDWRGLRLPFRRDHSRAGLRLGAPA